MTTHTKTPVAPETQLGVIFNPAALVDELGLLKAQIAALEAREKEITAALKNGGRDAYAGQLYDCTVSTSERTTVKTKELRADMGDDVLKDYLTTSTVTTLKVTAKK